MGKQSKPGQSKPLAPKIEPAKPPIGDPPSGTPPKVPMGELAIPTAPEPTPAAPILVHLDLTLEQAELCRQALLAAPLAGNLATMVQVVERVHATVKIFEEGIKVAVAKAVKVEKPTPEQP